MASKKNALSSLIPELDLDLYTGVHFLPTYEEGIRIVQIKNAGGKKLLRFFKEDVHLFQCRPEELLEECYCFTKLEPLGNNKVNRTLRDGSGYWKHISTEAVKDGNKESIGWVTKLVFRKDKNTPTEWHILEYKDKERADAGPWVLCQIYKREKNNDSGGSGRFPPAGQIYSSTSQVSSMRAIGASGDLNQGQHYEMGQCSYTQPDSFSNAASNPELTGGHMYQDQIHSVGQSWYTPQNSMVYNSQQFLSSPNSIEDFYMGLLDDESINQDPPQF